MYFVATTLYFTAQNNDRKLGNNLHNKNEIWNVMYDIQINYNKTSESDWIFFSQEYKEKQKATSLRRMHVSTKQPQCSRHITTDATLVVEGKEIPVNRGLLTVCSPALSKKFPAGTNKLELNDEKYDQMFLLVQQLIPEHIVSTPVEGEPP